MLKNIRNIILVACSAVVMVSCYDPTQKADGKSLSKSIGVEYAPQMYHSEAYDPMSQVRAKDAGANYFPWINVGGGESDYDSVESHGEFYNSNYYNEYGMNMRKPETKSIARGLMPYALTYDQIDLSDSIVPAMTNEGVVYAAMKGGGFISPELDIAKGEALYGRFCIHCHGSGVMDKEGNYTPGKVGEKFGGVPAYNAPATKGMTIGHVFHVITHGKNAMGAHASQISQKERWNIAAYVQTLQKK